MKVYREYGDTMGEVATCPPTRRLSVGGFEGESEQVLAHLDGHLAISVLGADEDSSNLYAVLRRIERENDAKTPHALA